MDFGNCYLATGNNFPDALAGSALAAITKSPVILVSSLMDQSMIDYIKSEFNRIKKVIAFGGIGVVPESILIDIIYYFNGDNVMPDVSPEMNTPTYWIGLYSDADKVILDAKGIEAFNKK